MKKSLIALAVMAAAGAASAQSSVTLFGVVDVGLSRGTGSGLGSADRTQLTSGAYNSSRIGFRGTEDLGGGMSASFWLEAGISADNGSGGRTSTNNQASGTNGAAAGSQGLSFNRRSTVSLAGGWGEARLGRDYTPEFWNLTVFDPFGSVGVGASQGTITHWAITGVGGGVDGIGVRASNSIGYFLPPNLGGFYGQIGYWMGENLETGAATEDDGTGFGLRLGYATGPFNTAVAYQRTQYATGDLTNLNIGGSWDIGMAKIMAQYLRDRFNGPASLTHNGWLVGALVPVGAGEIRVAYSQSRLDDAFAVEPRARKLSLGYVHNLSKRTAVYTTIARVRNSGGAAFALGGAATAPNSSSNGFDVGVRHSF